MERPPKVNCERGDLVLLESAMGYTWYAVITHGGPDHISCIWMKPDHASYGWSVNLPRSMISRLLTEQEGKQLMSFLMVRGMLE